MLVTSYDRGSEHKDGIHSPVNAADVATSHAADAVFVKVSDIPPDMSEDVVRMIFENKRYGGADIKTLEFSKSDNTAVIQFESSTGNMLFFEFH